MEVFATMFWVVFGIFLFSFVIVGAMTFNLVSDEPNIGSAEVIEVVFLTLISKETPIIPPKVPAKIFLFSLSMCGALVFYSYNAGLVSLLAAEVFWFPIDSVEVHKP